MDADRGNILLTLAQRIVSPPIAPGTSFTISYVLLPLFTNEGSNDYAMRLIKEHDFDPDPD